MNSYIVECLPGASWLQGRTFKGHTKGEARADINRLLAFGMRSKVRRLPAGAVLRKVVS